MYRDTRLDLEFVATLLTTLKGAVTIAPVVRATTVPKDRTGVRVEHDPFEQSAKLSVDAVRVIIRAIIKFFILNSPRLKKVNHP